MSYYCQTSSFLDVPSDKLDKLKEIMNKFEDDTINGEYEDYICVNFEYTITDRGIWFFDEEYVEIEQLAIVSHIIIEDLELDTPFYCSWANTSNDLEIDGFDGGTFVIKRGIDTIWIIPAKEAEKQLKEKLNSIVKEIDF